MECLKSWNGGFFAHSSQKTFNVTDQMEKNGSRDATAEDFGRLDLEKL